MAAMMVIIGTIDRSWKRRTEKARSPRGWLSWPVPRSIGSTCAVEDKCKRQADGDARFQAEAQREMHERGKCEAAHEHLHQAEAENVLPQPPQPVRVQLEPDEEQQQRDADFRHGHDGIGLADQAKRLRTDDRPTDDIAEGRAEPELAEYGDEQQRGAEHDARRP